MRKATDRNYTLAHKFLVGNIRIAMITNLHNVQAVINTLVQRGWCYG